MQSALCVPAFSGEPRKKKRRRGIILPHIQLVMAEDSGLDSASSSCCSSAATSPTPSDVDSKWLDGIVFRDDFHIEEDLWKVLDEFTEEIKQLIAADDLAQQQRAEAETAAAAALIVPVPIKAKSTRKPRKKNEVV